MKKKLSAVLAVTLLTATLSACGAQQSATPVEGVTEDQGIPVEVFEAVPSGFSVEGDFVGQLAPAQTVQIFPGAVGVVESVNVAVGDMVYEGDVLFTIDSEGAQLSLNQAQNAYDQAVAGIEQGRINSDRGVIGAESAHEQLLDTKESTLEDMQEQIDSLYDTYDDMLSGQAPTLDDPLPPTQVTAIRPTMPTLDPTDPDYDNAMKQYNIDMVEYTAAVATNQGAVAAYNAQLAMIEAQNDEIEESFEEQLQDMLDSIGDLEDAYVDTAETFDEQIADSLESLDMTLDGVNISESSYNSQLSNAYIGIASAQLKLEGYVITSPITGTVDSVTVTEDNMASSQSAALVISNHDDLEVTFAVSSTVVSELTLGQAVTVYADDVPYAAEISEIAPAANSQTRLYTVVAKVDAAGDSLPLNTTVLLSLNTKTVADSIVIPYDALRFSSDRTYVYVYTDGKAVQTDVEIGDFNDTEVEILSGLSMGDLVISTWAQGLRHNANVVLAESQSGTDSGN